MQSIAIIASSKDQAGINIRNNLTELFDFEKTNEKFDGNDVYLNNTKNKIIKLYLIGDDLIFAENIDRRIDADLFIFASKHRSKENTPSFAVHPIGNWGKADFGGAERKLCISPAILLKNLFIELNTAAKDTNFELTMESTHHGPYVEKPVVFVEIGSTEKEWVDKDNGKTIANTIMRAIDKEELNYLSCILVGGGHYNQAANKLMLRTNYAVGHICPKYALEHFDEEMLLEAINKTTPKPNIVLLDWKGLGQNKQRIVGLLKSTDLEFNRTYQILSGS